MTTYYVRPDQAGTYGTGDGSSFANAATLSYWYSTIRSTLVSSDVVYFAGADENGFYKPFSLGTTKLLLNPGAGVTVSGLPPEMQERAHLTDPVWTFRNQVACIETVSRTSAGDHNGAVFEDLILSHPDDTKTGGTNPALIHIAHINNVTFRRLKLIGNGSSANLQAWNFAHSTDGQIAGKSGIGLVRFEDCEIEDIVSNGYFNNSGWTADYPFRLQVVGCTFTRCRGQMVYNESADDPWSEAYYSLTTVVNQLPHQLIVTDCLFEDCGSNLIHCSWIDETDSGFKSQIARNRFVRSGAIQWGQTTNVINTHGCLGGEIIGNVFDGHEADAYDSDGACVIIDFKNTTGSDYGSDRVVVAGNTFRDVVTSAEAYAAAGKDQATQRGHAKGVAIWFGADCLVARNQFIRCESGLRISRARCTGHVILANWFEDNYRHIQHKQITDTGPAFTAVGNRFAQAEFGAYVADVGVDAPTWTSNKTVPGLLQDDYPGAALGGWSPRSSRSRLYI